MDTVEDHAIHVVCWPIRESRYNERIVWQIGRSAEIQSIWNTTNSKEFSGGLDHFSWIVILWDTKCYKRKKGMKTWVCKNMEAKVEELWK